jgi:hypothetical protein
MVTNVGYCMNHKGFLDMYRSAGIRIMNSVRTSKSLLGLIIKNAVWLL